jgi:hypothetical protein
MAPSRSGLVGLLAFALWGTACAPPPAVPGAIDRGPAAPVAAGTVSVAIDVQHASDAGVPDVAMPAVHASDPIADGGSAPPVAPEAVGEPLDDATFVFDPTQLRTYNLIVAPSDLDLIDQNPSAEMYVPASLELDGQRFGPYRVRYKGSGGAWEPPCTLGGSTLATPKIGKCSVKVDFDLGDGATFHGLKKLNFHAMGHDRAMLRERLAYELFREMRVAAPRAMHARLLINGQLEGLFVAVEQIDGRFTRSRFADGGQGNLYKEVWPSYSDRAVYAAALETNTKRSDVQRMLDFKAAVDTGADALSRFIDRDYLLRYIAVDRVTVNDDGMFHFWCAKAAQGNNPGLYGNHNYYWYEAEAGQRFWLIPWDLDYTFDGRADVAIYPEWTQSAPCLCRSLMYGLQRPASCDPIVSYLRSWLADYERYVDELLGGPFEAKRVDGLLDSWAAQIHDAVQEASDLKGAPTFSDWLSEVAQLRANIENARQHRGRAY